MHIPIFSTLLYSYIIDDQQREHLYNMHLIDSYDELLKLAANQLKLYLNDFDLDQIIIEEEMWVSTANTAPPHIHNHKNASFVSVVYLNAPGSDGKLMLYDPRVNANRGYPNIFTSLFKSIPYQPINGEILIMPGFLYHSVEQKRDRHRVAIVIDYFMNDKG